MSVLMAQEQDEQRYLLLFLKLLEAAGITLVLDTGSSISLAPAPRPAAAREESAPATPEAGKMEGEG
jgi:hypothetical protein